MIVVKDAVGYVFGAFLEQEIKNIPRFSGEADSFVFTFKDNEDLQLWDATGDNHFYQYTVRDFIMIGAPSTHEVK